MANPLVIKGKELSAKVDEFIEEVRLGSAAALSRSASSADFKNVYMFSLAAESVLPILRNKTVRPSVSALRNTNRRIPLLISLGQASLAKVELRRFMELVFWSIYFTHHPREWDHFDGKKMVGFSRDQTKPIGYAAHRDLNFYIQYATEYMESEPSGLATAAIKQLDDVKKNLNAAVHAGQIARLPTSQLPFDLLSDRELRAFSKMQEQTLAASMILLFAFDRAAFQRMPGGPRAYFDWLIGAASAKRLRSAQFGLDMTNPLGK